MLMAWCIDRLAEVELYGRTTVNIGELSLPWQLVEELLRQFSRPVREWEAPFSNQAPVIAPNPRVVPANPHFTAVAIDCLASWWRC